MKKFLKTFSLWEITRRVTKFLVVLFLITGWLFSGFPQIFNPSTLFRTGFPPKIEEAQAAFGVGNASSVSNNKVSGTSWNLTLTGTGTYNAGNIAVLWFAGDNLATVDGNDQLLSSVTDSALNTWNVQRCFTNAQTGAGTGATTCLAWSKLTADLVTGSNTITLNFSGAITAKAFAMEEFTVAAGKTIAVTGTPQDLANDGADPGSMTISGLASAEHLFIRATALERAGASTWTVTLGFTTSNCTGTSGGSANTNMNACGEFQIFTGTSLASNPTATAVDNANTYIAFDEVTPTFNQSAYRLFNNLDSTDVGTALAAQDTAATLGSTGAAFRLRMLLHIGAAQLWISGQSFKLQFAQQSGTCDTGFVGETYADVTAATVIAYNNNATPADGAALTANASDPTHGVDTNVNQTYEELNNFTNSVAAIPAAQDGKWDFSLKDNGATASTAYCLRAIKSDGTVLDTYTQIPQITTAAAASLTFTIDTNNVSFVSTITPGTPVSTSSVLTINTNNSTGYNVTINRASTTPTLFVFTDNATTTVADTPNGNNWTSPGASATTTAGPSAVWTDGTTKGLGFRTKQTGTNSGAYHSAWWGASDAGANALYSGISTSTAAQLFSKNNVGTGSNENITVEYRIDVSNSQRSGTYISSPVIFTATAN